MKRTFYAIISGELIQNVTNLRVSFSIKGNWWINKSIEDQLSERLKYLHPSCILDNYEVRVIDNKTKQLCQYLIAKTVE